MTSSVSTLFIVIGLWFTLAFFCCGGGRAFKPTTPGNDSAMPVTARVLVAEYEANEIAADRKYKGKMVQVSGVVDSIGKDILDTMYVTLDSGQEFGITNVQCYFDNSAESYLASLQKGRSVVITCRCDGKFGNVLLKDCDLNRVGN